MSGKSGVVGWLFVLVVSVVIDSLCRYCCCIVTYTRTRVHVLHYIKEEELVFLGLLILLFH
jgi:hypothetical protein